MPEINLYDKDCRPAMKKMDDYQYDLAIVDPPYGIGQTWSKSRRDRFYGHISSYKNGKKEKVDSEYFQELFRVSKHQIIWGYNYYSHSFPEDNHIIIWDKGRDFSKTFMSEAELAWHSFSIPARICSLQWDGAKKGNETGIKKIHPFQKPIGLYKWLLRNYAESGWKILDTHGGSMSIAIACHDLGFDLDLYEKDKIHFTAGKKRFELHKSQLKMV